MAIATIDTYIYIYIYFLHNLYILQFKTERRTLDKRSKV